MLLAGKGWPLPSPLWQGLVSLHSTDRNSQGGDVARVENRARGSRTVAHGLHQRTGPLVGWREWCSACVLSRFSHVWHFVAPWTAAHQAPRSMGLFRQGYWCGLPWPPPETVVDRVNFKLYFKLPPLPTSSSPLNPRLNRIASPLTRSMAVAALRPLPISPFDKERAGSRLTVPGRSLARI